MLLPSGGDKASTPDAQINAVQAVTLASAAVSDMRGFCERNADACVVGGKVATVIGHRAEAGARTIFEFVSNKLTDNKPAPSEDLGPARVVGVSATGALGTPAVRGTLTPSDLKPGWHAPVPLPPRREARATRPAV
ncbi:MAG: DUF5330 domain-containing protein [Pseudolabrys sp.]